MLLRAGVWAISIAAAATLAAASTAARTAVARAHVPSGAPMQHHLHPLRRIIMLWPKLIIAVRIKGRRLDVVRVEEPAPVEQCGAHRLQLSLCLRCGVLNRGIPSYRAIWRVLRSVVRPRKAVWDVVVGWLTTVCSQAMYRCCSPRKPCLLALLDCPLHGILECRRLHSQLRT